jgi:hypothetical protein
MDVVLKAYELALEDPISTSNASTPRSATKSTCEKNLDRPISFYEKNKTPKGGSTSRDGDRIDAFLV